MKNMEWLVQKHISAYELLHDDNFINSLGCGAVFDVNREFIKWLDAEHIEPILDDEEREYLSAVIKPFRDRVKHICKVNYSGTSSSEYQYLFITLSDFSYNIDMPIFKRDTMYKGMKPNKDYTLEELGL